MKRLLTYRVAVLCCTFLVMISNKALAQTTGALDPSSTTPAERSGKGDVPLGGCMPIGLTASGEMVFPILCREFLEQHRQKDMVKNPAEAEQKVTVKPVETAAPSEHVIPDNASSESVVVKQKVTSKPLETAAPSEDPMIENSSSQPVAAEGKVTAKPEDAAAPFEDGMPGERKSTISAVSSRRTHKHELSRRAMNQAGCQNYRTYDSASETYRSYNGRRRSCR
jgi:hypothetical protein